MLISYNRPSDITLSLIGDGAAWLSDDNCRIVLDWTGTARRAA